MKPIEIHSSFKKNVVYERFVFFSRKQGEGENIDHFVNDLKRLAISCEFEMQEESLIRDRIVFGINDLKLQKRLLTKDDLNLDTAIRACRANEVSKTQIKIVQEKGVNQTKEEYKNTSEKNRNPEEINYNTIVASTTTIKVEKNSLINELNILIKDPLQNCWTLWLYENDRTQSWKKNQKEIGDFQTVKDFWSLYNSNKPASELRQGSDYSLFKKGIRPMFEDEANIRGGRWLLSLAKKQRSNDLTRHWLDTILCLIGEAFKNSEQVCGAKVNIRHQGDKLGIWTSDAQNDVAVLEIGRKLKERLRIPPQTILGYQVHKDWFKDKTGSVSKYSYTV